MLALAACSDQNAEAETSAPAATEAPAEVAPVEAPAEDTVTAPAAVEEEAAEAIADEVTEAVENTTPSIPSGDAMATNAMQMMSPEMQSALQDQIATMSDEEKSAAVAEARTTAEAAARQQGLADDLVQRVGDEAEAAARQMFGLAD
ncbi:hypothetical protein DVH29_02215 [Pelagibacterium lacus]|uniref:Uncharacterized protein n=1 Tax=Pelagibacterium lacus TaxID=2282655 RepID=A0A369W8D0_9HYPH|nr:hypothetical protein DVH29_02215 [Pelagibacterium lacus]